MKDPEYSIREARQEEEGLIRAMVRGAGINPLGLDWRRFLVAESEDGSVIGCVQRKPHAEGAVELASLVVRPDWRGHGVGGALIGAEKRRSGPPLWLMCRRGLVELYRRYGFEEPQEDERLPRYFHLVNLLVRIPSKLLGKEPGLAIMVWRGG